ncbi:hypothetical protein [Pseudomonas serboccidentalis]|uniref:hypothetical protein n=1 Tax=Pseudomonas serboccidentalis TaxID=2964670 RepID=UPI0039DFCC24
MEIVYLDQNKWVELARVHAGKIKSGPLVTLYGQLIDAVESGKVLFPLSTSHILETSKRNDPISRGHMAETQAALSRGLCYRSRAGRLEIEIRCALHRLFGGRPPELPEHWAIARGFLQAFEPLDSLISAPAESRLTEIINSSMDPADLYVSFMSEQDDSRRRFAHVKITEGMSEIISGIESRRALMIGDSLDLRRRCYSAQLFLDHQNSFIRILLELGYSPEQYLALGERIKSLIEDVPTLNIEAEMAARIEAESGSLKQNDIYDIQAFYTAIPYSSRVIAEKASISRARQAKLDVKYGVTFSRSLTDLVDLYS